MAVTEGGSSKIRYSAPAAAKAAPASKSSGIRYQAEQSERPEKPQPKWVQQVVNAFRQGIDRFGGTYLQMQRGTPGGMAYQAGRNMAAGAPDWVARRQAAARDQSGLRFTGASPDRAFNRPESYDWLKPDYREQYADMLMTPDEYSRRRTATARTTNAYQTRLKEAQATPKVMHDITSDFGKVPMPNPLGISQDEWIKRNNTAPTGYMYTPFGSGYARANTLKSLASGTGSGSSKNPYGWGSGGNWWGGGGWDDWGDYGNAVRNWYNALVNWRI